MPPPIIPTISFSPWVRWVSRPRPSQELDVPQDFGILGLYLLARETDDKVPDASTDGFNLPASVIYIGFSRHVDRRLEASHGAVLRYRNKSGDAQCKKLWFAMWRSDWSSMAHKAGRKPQQHTALALYERAAIHAFAAKHGNLPEFNRA